MSKQRKSQTRRIVDKNFRLALKELNYDLTQLLGPLLLQLGTGKFEVTPAEKKQIHRELAGVGIEVIGAEEEDNPTRVRITTIWEPT